MDNPVGILTEKLGPLPVWAWGLGGAVAFRVFTGYRSSHAVTTAPPADDSANAAPDLQGAALPGSPNAGYSAIWPQYGTGGLISPSSPAPSSSTDAGTTGTAPVPAPQDNYDWQRRATDYLSARGVDPIAAADAISLYISGSPITAAQRAMVNLALTGVGQPPNAVPASTVIPDPSPTAPAPAAPTPQPNVGGWQLPPWLHVGQYVRLDPATAGLARNPQGVPVSAVYKVTASGLAWIQSPEALTAQLGHQFSDADFLNLPASTMASLPRVGLTPDRQYDVSLPG